MSVSGGDSDGRELDTHKLSNQANSTSYFFRVKNNPSKLIYSCRDFRSPYLKPNVAQQSIFGRSMNMRVSHVTLSEIDKSSTLSCQNDTVKRLQYTVWIKPWDAVRGAGMQ